MRPGPGPRIHLRLRTLLLMLDRRTPRSHTPMRLVTSSCTWLRPKTLLPV
jgi:hypothetical protein